jgi:16S rRNA (cytosine1402-N4)-methyltransferase
MYHIPVLLKESIDLLEIQQGGVYVDVTYGGGGHTREMFSRAAGNVRVIAFDQDADAIKNKIDNNNLLLLNQNFRYLKNFLRLYNTLPVDGILADLGVSSHQFDAPDRGFSIRLGGELDLRMDRKKTSTAATIINTYTEKGLATLFHTFGEIKNAGRLAKQIIEARRVKSIQTIEEFIAVIETCIDKKNENKYLAQVFQALRIEVNHELEALKELLIQSAEVLKPGGRLVIISYQSLEDRLVKNYLRSGNFEGTIEKDFFGNVQTPWKVITRKPITPNEEETVKNNRARSAKLRAAIKI